MTSSRARTAVAAAALLVLGLAGWWLFGGGTGSRGPGEGEGPGPRDGVSQSDTNTPDVAGKEAGEAAAAPRGGPQGHGAAEVAAAAKPEETVEGVCVLEDGAPLAGVRLDVTISRERDERLGTVEASASDGTFTIDRTPFPVVVDHEDADLVSCEGADLAAPGEGRRSFRPTGGRVVLRFRDRPGTAHVRLLDAETRRPVTDVAGLRVDWVFPGGKITMSFPSDPGKGGWTAVPEGKLPETGGDDQASIKADAADVQVEFAMPGFEGARLALADIHGRIQVPVRPVPPDVKGDVVRSGRQTSLEKAIGRTGGRIESRLLWMGPDPAPSTERVAGMPGKLGPFALYGVPDGTWKLELADRTIEGATVRGQRTFERRGDVVDLGTIELATSGRVSLLAYDAANEAIPQAWAVVVRPGEDPDQARRLEFDETGRAAVADLEPGVTHRAIVRGLPRELEKPVKAEAEPTPVSFQWPEKLVPCRITLLVDGKAVANPDGRTTIPAVVQESPLPREKGAWKSDGTFEAKLVPGTYRFSVLATPKEGGALALFAGEVTVPSGDSFDTRLELQREGR